MQQRYPAVRLLVQHGMLLAWVLPAIVTAVGILGFILQWGVWLAAGIIVGGIVLFCVLRVFIELVQIIAETLLPQ